LSCDPDALGIQSSTGLWFHTNQKNLIRMNQNRRRKTLQRIGFVGGLTHRRTPSPAFLFP